MEHIWDVCLHHRAVPVGITAVTACAVHLTVTVRRVQQSMRAIKAPLLDKYLSGI